jgi:LysM repeat protein
MENIAVLRKKRSVLTLLLALTLALSLVLVGVEVTQAADQTYVVQRGDNLTSIAARYGVTVTAISQANKIVNVNNIYAGQRLIIPGANGTPTSTPTSTPATTTTTGEQGYIVQRGDSLSAIAVRFGVSVRELASANNISLMDYIYAGQTLRIPGRTVTNTTATPTTAAPVVKSPATATPVPPTKAAAAPVSTNPASSGKWIDVNLSQQKLTAYEGSTSVFTTAVSTGVASHPTVTGTFNIYIKYTSQAMSGGSGREYYYLPGVPYVMYFYGSYAIHGTYWHHNFGHPMSHGCVNLPTPAAQFMYGWAPMGTPVKVHY